jgi:hypothetical protein
MDIGMLWFDNDKQAELSVKIQRAVSYYQKKYGQKPNLCFVNPCMISPNGNGSKPPKENDTPKNANGVEIRESNSMLPNHLWIGINRQSA